MKRLIYSCIAVCALIFTSCADQDVTENINGSENKPGVTVSMSLEGNMQGNQTAPVSRANTNIGYKTDESTGFPTPVGLFDAVGNDGKEIAEGTKVPVVLIFRSTDNSQPITKVETKWTYHKGGDLTLEPSETFNMEASTDLTKGTWYVCGILGGEFLKGQNQVKINPFSEGHVAKVNNQEVTWGANIPYIFGWRELVAKSKTTFKAKDNKPVRFKQFGTIVRLKVTNKTGFNFKYNGVRIITSNILCGQFDLKAFDDKTLVPTLKDTKDGDVETPTSEDYKNVFKPFKFYQRPTTDNAIVNTLSTRNRYRIKGDFIANYAEEKANDAKNDNDLTKKLNTALTYYDHTFLKDATGNNFDNVPNNDVAPSYIYVWMAPQTQAVKLYNDNAESSTSTNYTVNRVAKTQFLLMAIPTETSTSSPVIPTSINMIPAYGTRADYVSGVNYSARGSVVYKFPPLSYIAKHDNFGTDAELSVDNDYNVANTKRYTYQEYVVNTEKITDKLASIPSGYMFAGNEYWRSIIAQYYGFAGFRNAGTSYKYSVGFVSPAKLPGWSTTKLVFHSYSKGVKDSNGKLIAYMIGMSKKPDYITNSVEGQVYMGHVTTPTQRVSAGLDGDPTWIDNNNYRYTIRYEDVNGSAVLTQRYLGPRFVLDMDDIDTEDFWADPSNGTTYPADTKRIFPYAGVNSSTSVGNQTFWFYETSTLGKGTQYWTPDNTTDNGRYTPQNSDRTGAMLGLGGVRPKQAVAFMGSQGGDQTCGFFQHYLYINVPTTGNVAQGAKDDPRFKLNFIMSAPVRLWKTTPYAD
ncbi:hypothetical protein F0475_00490 [Prevotella sp. A2879]|uniref:Uncharacterized protein n=1 Tax=Prevotella vespertina TaxID=2608404 RepID=A0A7C9HCP7_9BACT|nr:hypothetical protein [Prevotella vespertina]MUL26828.1 hypothetical protein [Prevotella vespertina]